MPYETAPGSPEQPLIDVIPLRIGAGLTLLYMHAWQHAFLAWRAVWHQEPWEVIGVVEQSGLPLPKVLAAFAAGVAIFTAVCWILGFFTRFASVAFIPVTLGALWVCNRVGQSFGAESCILFLLIAITLIIKGPGWLSVDALFSRGKKQRKAIYL
ncbi:DoxX family protein [Verrucomicrobium sp. BvORR034]|jgi:uncharacterized membrane protein YphA (DoxX/SURF4 family)|uniref:DoxX family protein n=1 Tax=Verrucomicrobium sp. BvORR034 TaxID=1396418 RepID=UPI000678E1DD|nr:DoxX family protein [Verrucomicrobium sp. BvORR034]